MRNRDRLKGVTLDWSGSAALPVDGDWASELMNVRVARRQRLLAAVMVEPHQKALFDLVKALLKEGVEPYDLVDDVQSIRESENLSDHEDDKLLDVLDGFIGYAGVFPGFIPPEEMVALAERWENRDRKR